MTLKWLLGEMGNDYISIATVNKCLNGDDSLTKSTMLLCPFLRSSKPLGVQDFPLWQPVSFPTLLGNTNVFTEKQYFVQCCLH